MIISAVWNVQKLDESKVKYQNLSLNLELVRFTKVMTFTMFFHFHFLHLCVVIYTRVRAHLLQIWLPRLSIEIIVQCWYYIERNTAPLWSCHSKYFFHIAVYLLSVACDITNLHVVVVRKLGGRFYTTSMHFSNRLNTYYEKQFVFKKSSHYHCVWCSL